MKKNYFYLITIQYLGFRYHGWQKQNDVKTVQMMVDKTLSFILGDEIEFKTIAAGRTDSMVSAQDAVFQLYSTHEYNSEKLLKELNTNLPGDIKALKVEVIDKNFRIMNSSKSKIYSYFFCFGDRPHPFSAPFMIHINEELDIERMKEGAKVFLGKHYFKHYIYRPTPEKQLWRIVDKSEIIKNTELTANFFPDESYIFRVQGPGFGRHQVRIMMGQLLELGMGKITIEDLKSSLTEDSKFMVKFIAPASGLMLSKTEFL